MKYIYELDRNGERLGVFEDFETPLQIAHTIVADRDYRIIYPYAGPAHGVRFIDNTDSAPPWLADRITITRTKLN